MKKRLDKSVIVALVFAIIVVVLFATLMIFGNQYTEYEYSLSELKDGVYGVYSTVVSSIPAKNYDVITLCCDGSIKTFKGTVHVIYTDGEIYAKYKNSRLVNADEIWVYVPFGTIEYQGTTGISGRR